MVKSLEGIFPTTSAAHQDCLLRPLLLCLSFPTLQSSFAGPMLRHRLRISLPGSTSSQGPGSRGKKPLPSFLLFR